MSVCLYVFMSVLDWTYRQTSIREWSSSRWDWQNSGAAVSRRFNSSLNLLTVAWFQRPRRWGQDAEFVDSCVVSEAHTLNLLTVAWFQWPRRWICRQLHGFRCPDVDFVDGCMVLHGPQHRGPDPLRARELAKLANVLEPRTQICL